MEVDTLVKGIKLPARIGKTWVSKDPVVDLKKLDHYFLSSAVLSPTNLVLTFSNDETDSSYTFHSSVSEDSHFLEIEYRDQMQTVNITSQPAMNSAVNRDVLISLISQIRVAMLYLRDHKLRLSRLILREIDILATMKVTDLFYTILEILSPLITQEVTGVLGSTQEIDDSDQGGLTRNFIYQRLSLLGDRSKTEASVHGDSGVKLDTHGHKRQLKVWKIPLTGLVRLNWDPASGFAGFFSGPQYPCNRQLHPSSWLHLLHTRSEDPSGSRIRMSCLSRICQ
ncbi:MAG: hypothetical protein AMDU1_APLC00026G0006 [Thermoplasmatales archaeon A-plasma]|nr:MAG: hypothetical protein AMDU1_APLC00026G0006 [Thermoplasmatales archaeon A-plasma]